jgi:hypothetical protein
VLLVVEPILADTPILIRFRKTPLSRFLPPSAREILSFVILDSSRLETIRTTGRLESPNSRFGAAGDVLILAGRTKIVCGLVENYGVGIADVTRQVGISPSGVSNILTRTLSS